VEGEHSEALHCRDLALQCILLPTARRRWMADRLPHSS
jgi:hypothetical protein